MYYTLGCKNVSNKSLLTFKSLILTDSLLPLLIVSEVLYMEMQTPYTVVFLPELHHTSLWLQQQYELQWTALRFCYIYIVGKRCEKIKKDTWNGSGLLQSRKTNYFESRYLLPQLQQISELKQTKQTTMLEWSRNTIIRFNYKSFTKTGLVTSQQDKFGPDFAHLKKIISLLHQFGTFHWQGYVPR